MISCVLLSAGESFRFGSPKALAKIGRGSAIEHILQNLSSIKEISQIVVVLGARAQDIRPAIKNSERVDIVVNELYPEGQTSSFQKGILACRPESDGFMLFPVDLPFVKTETLKNLIKKFDETQSLIVVPAFRDRRGHPPIFSKKLQEEILQLSCDQPLCNLLGRYSAQLLTFKTQDEGVVCSFNTPAELSAIRQRLERKPEP